MDITTVINILDSLSSEYSKNFSDKEKSLKARNWLMILEDVTAEQVKTGLKKALLDPGEFMPTVGKFRELCLSGKGCNSLDDEALNAWPTALKAIQRAGAWVSPVFKDSCIAEAIRKMGGWEQFCKMLVDEQPFRKKDFIDYYVVAKRQDKNFTPVLMGQYKDYTFIGYAEGEDFKKLTSQIKRAEELERSITNTIHENVKALQRPEGTHTFNPEDLKL